jgi:glycosyltransferase involved in cell wall biosynthesis
VTYFGQKLRVLWLSNAILCDGDQGYTGTWLHAMAWQLVSSGEVTLGNISSGRVKGLTRQDCGDIKQWVVRASGPSARDGLPSRKVVADILKAANEFSPDLVHVWGTESYWGLLSARKLIKQRTLLETQGLKFAIASVFAGGLSFKEQLACVGLKELFRGTTIPQKRKCFEKWGTFEREIITGHRYVATQTDWVKAHVESINPTCTAFHSDLILREPFYQAAPWQFSQKPLLFCSAAYSAPFKGLHVAIRAAALLRRKLPGLQLCIAGPHRRYGTRREGYIAWVENQARDLGLAENVRWLGSIGVDQISKELTSASAIVLPSFIENCSTFMQEAMAVGIPVVASYSGGLPSLARDEESALFFPPGDEAMCASQLERVLTDGDLATRLSCNARAVAFERNDPAKIVAKQLEIYRQVIADNVNEGKS